jgi:hypothetical protein
MAAIFRNQVLIDAASIAIWNRNKVVVALTTIVCVICIGFHLQSKSLLLTPSTEYLESHTNVGLVTDVIRVNGQFNCLYTLNPPHP